MPLQSPDTFEAPEPKSGSPEKYFENKNKQEKLEKTVNAIVSVIVDFINNSPEKVKAMGLDKLFTKARGMINDELNRFGISMDEDQGKAVNIFLDNLKYSIMANEEDRKPEERIGFLRRIYDLDSPSGLLEYQIKLINLALGKGEGASIYWKEFFHSDLVGYIKKAGFPKDPIKAKNKINNFSMEFRIVPKAGTLSVEYSGQNFIFSEQELRHY